MRHLFFCLIGMLTFSQPQEPPDSLLSRVVIFKRSGSQWEIGSDMAWGYPQATGFYLDTGSVKCAFVVTARHVLHTPDSVAGLHMHIVEASGRAYDEYLGDYRRSRAVVTHPDFWVDIALLGNQPSTEARDSLSGFRPSDIVTREEFQRISPGNQAFYIGMCLDSIASKSNVYSFPEGRWLDTFSTGKLMIDSVHEMVWRADFSLKIQGTPGVSGSPVLLREGSSYRLVGVVNGFGVDASGKMVDTAYCTAAYRILEALQDTSEDRWQPKDLSGPMPRQG